MTFIIKTRGDAKALIAAEYECPAHGRFGITVPRDQVPDKLACPRTIIDAERDGITRRLPNGVVVTFERCFHLAPWCFPRPAGARVQSVTAARRGKDPERPANCVDWEALAYDEKPPEEVHAAQRKQDWHDTRALVKAGLR